MPWVVKACGRRGATGGVRGLFWSIVCLTSNAAGGKVHIGSRDADCQRYRSGTRGRLVDHRVVWLGLIFRQCPDSEVRMVLRPLFYGLRNRRTLANILI